jgi:hypothetical protein
MILGPLTARESPPEFRRAIGISLDVFFLTEGRDFARSAIDLCTEMHAEDPRAYGKPTFGTKPGNTARAS